MHLPAQLHPAIPISRLVGDVKGVSSHLVTHEIGRFFRWLAGYGAFTVYAADVAIVSDYVHNQAQHHARHTLNPALELPADA